MRCPRPVSIATAVATRDNHKWLPQPGSRARDTICAYTIALYLISSKWTMGQYRTAFSDIGMIGKRLLKNTIKDIEVM